MLGFTILSQSGFVPQIAPCLEHVCAGGGGGSVAFEVFTCILCVLRMGLYLSVDIILLV